MALSDLQVYSETAYSSMTEVLQQQVELFNAASNGAIVLQSAAHQGDFSETAFWANVDGLVRRRNPYGTGAIPLKSLKQVADTMVKVAAGTPEIDLSPGQFKWIQQNPEVAGAVLGQQLAKQTLADMLNTGLGAFYVAHVQKPLVTLDITGETPPDDKMSFDAQLNAQAKLGDGSGGEIALWVMHSKPMFDIYRAQLANNTGLFTYGNVKLIVDPMGKRYVMTDSPSLVTAGTPPVYHSLGLKPGAIQVDQNNDFDDNWDSKNGDENIVRTYQAEWSYNLGIMGFGWDKSNGGKAPNDAALMVSTNWDQVVTSHKNLGGVVINSH